MTDISKCKGDKCPYDKKKCYRYTAPASEWQSYIFPLIENNTCMYFWDIEKEKKKDATN